MQIFKFVALLVAVAAISRPAAAQNFPDKLVKMIVPASAGGNSDVFARVLGDQFQQRTGRPLIVESRPGGAFNIGGQACADSVPDGYTFCLLPIETLAYNQYLFKTLSYDPSAFEPVTNVFFVVATLVVNSSLKIKTLDDLAAASKAKPNTLSY
jgi:tripartite-type tricarboxylate transporter receptor subunit TctC